MPYFVIAMMVLAFLIVITVSVCNCLGYYRVSVLIARCWLSFIAVVVLASLLLQFLRGQT